MMFNCSTCGSNFTISAGKPIVCPQCTAHVERTKVTWRSVAAGLLRMLADRLYPQGALPPAAAYKPWGASSTPPKPN